MKMMREEAKNKLPHTSRMRKHADRRLEITTAYGVPLGLVIDYHKMEGKLVNKKE
jgi:hypothetical protein